MLHTEAFIDRERGMGCSKKTMTDIEHKECVRSQLAQYQIDNKERIANRKRNKYIVDSAPAKASSKKWADSNKDKVRNQKRNYRSTPTGRLVAINDGHRRRAIVKNAGKYTVAEWNRLLINYNHTCLRCGCDNCKLTADHVIPLSKGGLNTIDNIQPLCQSCNSSKNNRQIDYR